MSTTENLADIPEAHEEENGSVKDCTHRKASLAKKDIGKSSTLSCQKNDKSGSTSEETRCIFLRHIPFLIVNHSIYLVHLFWARKLG